MSKTKCNFARQLNKNRKRSNLILWLQSENESEEKIIHQSGKYTIANLIWFQNYTILSRLVACFIQYLKGLWFLGVETISLNEKHDV